MTHAYRFTKFFNKWLKANGLKPYAGAIKLGLSSAMGYFYSHGQTIPRYLRSLEIAKTMNLSKAQTAKMLNLLAKDRAEVPGGKKAKYGRR